MNEKLDEMWVAASSGSHSPCFLFAIDQQALHAATAECGNGSDTSACLLTWCPYSGASKGGAAPYVMQAAPELGFTVHSVHSEPLSLGIRLMCTCMPYTSQVTHWEVAQQRW